MKSLGNHEFDNGVSGLTPFIENINTPVLCSNLILTKVPELAREENLKKSIIIDVDGVKVGIVGYLTPDTKQLAVPNDVEYIDEIVALREEIQNLQSQGIKIIIGLGHSGYSRDLQIAKEVEGLDLVIGGHTNTFLWNGTSPDAEHPQGPYPTYVKQASGRTVLVVQAYAYTKYLGRLHLKFDPLGEITHADGIPILLDRIVPQDPEVLKLLHKYRENILSTTEDILGRSSVILDGDCAQNECNLGNLITDAMVDEYAFHYNGEHWTDAPIAIIQAGGIRTSVVHAKMPSNITKGDLLAVLPFEGNMTTLTVNGSVILAMLEHSVAEYETAEVAAGFLQFSGIKVVYNLNNEIGSRVVKAEARCWTCNVPKYYKVQKKEIYKILMPGFLGKGGDGFSMFIGSTSEPLGYSELTCTQNYSLGNHEFDEAVDGLTPFISNISSPVLAANLILDKVPELEYETNLYPSVVLKKNGRRIGIIGYLTAETKFLAPKNNVEYEDEVSAISREVKRLKEKGVNIFIALGHSGFVKDLEIAREVEDIDLVIGGHSNTFLWNGNFSNEIPEVPQGPYPVKVQQASGRIVRVVQAYAYTKYLGKMHIIFDPFGEIIECDGIPILLDQTIPKDPEVSKLVDKYRYEADLVNNVVVGTSFVTLHGEYCRLRECNIGVIITEAMLNYTKATYTDPNQINIAIIQGGRIRTSIGHPNIPFNMTRGDWVTVIPFTDALVLVTMNGSILRQSLEHAVEGWRPIDSPGQFLQFTGMNVTYDLAKPPGSRVVIAKAMCLECNEMVDIEDQYHYKLLMSEFLADGGDGFTMFEKLDKEILTYAEVDCLVYYLGKTGPIKQEETGRLVILNADKIDGPQINYIMNGLPSSQTKVFHSSTLYWLVTLLLFNQL